MEKISLEIEMDDGCIVVENRARRINGSQVKVLDNTNEISNNDKLLMNRKVFPSPRKVANFKECWRDTRFDKIRDHFDFKMADDNLTVFLNTTVNGETYGSILANEFIKLNKTGIQCKKEMTFYYCFDRLTYLCTVDWSTFPCNGAFKSALTIRLSSDAFLQSPVRNLTNLQENTKPTHYRSDGWLVLSREEELLFPAAILLAQEVLGCNNWKCLMHYKDEDQRMDLMFSHLNCLIIFQFEPGFPESFFDEDLWC
eukprot:gene17624-20313_t